MPRSVFYILAVVVALSLIPMGLIYRSQQSGKKQPRIQVVYDMDQQFSYKAQQESEFFADGVAMRGYVEGTVARGQLRDDRHLHTGRSGDDVELHVGPFRWCFKTTRNLSDTDLTGC